MLVADDHPIVREYLSLKIQCDPSFRVIGQADDGRKTLRMAAELRPDVLVLDIDMPELDGAGVLRGLRATELDIRVLVFTGHAAPGPLREVLSLKPDSLMYKVEGADALRRELVGMMSGGASVGRFRRDETLAAIRNEPDLTESEQVVLAFAARGRTVPELAARLNVSQRTAKERRRALCMRFGVSSIVGVVAAATRLGLLD